MTLKFIQRSTKRSKPRKNYINKITELFAWVRRS